jgi:hypothetical protein
MSTHHNDWVRGDQQVPSPSVAAASQTQRSALVGVGIDRTERRLKDVLFRSITA